MDLKDLRREIDRIDRQMVELFCQRMALSQRVAEYKKENGLPVLDAGREEEKLSDVAALAGEDMADNAVSLYKTVLELSRRHQEKHL